MWVLRWISLLGGWFESAVDASWVLLVFGISRSYTRASLLAKTVLNSGENKRLLTKETELCHGIQKLCAGTADPFHIASVPLEVAFPPPQAWNWRRHRYISNGEVEQIKNKICTKSRQLKHRDEQNCTDQWPVTVLGSHWFYWKVLTSAIVTLPGFMVDRNWNSSDW